MNKMLVCLMLSMMGQAHALEIVTDKQLEQIFDASGANGTFVLFDVSAGRITLHNPPRAEQRFIPASTFKIANSLIGLATGAVASVEEVLPYGGKPQSYSSWEQDMGLRDAIKISNVPVYQELARRIGLERMRENLASIPYGNHETGDEADTFWLKGPLQISALEQAKFLARLARGELPYTAEIQQSVRDIVRLEQSDERTLYGKTGWTTTPDPDIGWWVGWVVEDENVYSFALNIDMQDKGDIGKRIELGKTCLKALGVF